MRTVAVLLGTRPEAIKLAPVVQALRMAGWCEVRVIASGQHGTMFDDTLAAFSLVPDLLLQALRPGQSPATLLAAILERLEPALQGEPKPDAIVVQGDTTSALAGAMAGVYARIPVVHVEAGMRTGDPDSPFPEEVNRTLIADLARLHLATTPLCAANLLREGVDPATVYVTGNTVVDALHAVDIESIRLTGPLAYLENAEVPVVLATAHRRESWGEGIANIAQAIADVAARNPHVQFVVPLHPNPAVRASMEPPLSGLANVRTLEPLPYLPFCRLIARSTVVLTDSGGVLTEAATFGTPVLIARDTTEQPEAIQSGTARLVGTDRTAIAEAIESQLQSAPTLGLVRRRSSVFGDGHAAVRVVSAIAELLGEGTRVMPFEPPAPVRSSTRGG